MKLLITGGAGFIGSNFCLYWLNNHPKDKIIVLDKLTYAGDLDNLLDIKNHSGFSFVNGDIGNNDLVEKILLENKIDTIVHFAAESHVTRSEKDPSIFYKTNVEGTINLLESAKNNQVRKFIHISTDEVYGSIDKGFFKEKDKKFGDIQASSDYAKSKSLADDLVLKYSQKLFVVVARPTNNFGPRQYPEKALPRWITNLILGEKIPVWGHGKQVRDWLFVYDTCRAIELLIKKGKRGQAYNIGANNKPEITNRQIAEWLVEIFCNDKKMIDFIPDPRKHHDFRYGVDTTKIGKLGWRPSQNVKKNFSETVEWYKNNQTWWHKHKKEAEQIYQ